VNRTVEENFKEHLKTINKVIKEVQALDKKKVDRSTHKELEKRVDVFT